MDLGLKGRRVLVTGGAGFLGQAICRAMAAEGATPIVHYKSRGEEAERLAADIAGIALQADLTSELETARLFAEIDRLAGGLDDCICCAGVRPSQRKPVSEMLLSEWHASCTNNLVMAFLTAREYLRRMGGRRDASLVLIGSSSEVYGHPGRAGFAAAKSGMSFGLLQSLTDEMAQICPGGRVNAISPGFTEAAGTASTAASGAHRRDAMVVSALPRPAAPEDVAHAAIWLASPVASAAVTGRILRVDAGQSGRLRWKEPFTS